MHVYQARAPIGERGHPGIGASLVVNDNSPMSIFSDSLNNTRKAMDLAEEWLGVERVCSTRLSLLRSL